MEERDEEMIAEIDLHENATHVVVDGRHIKISPMLHGTDEIVWKDGKPWDLIRTQRIRLASEEEITETPSDSVSETDKTGII